MRKAIPLVEMVKSGKFQNNIDEIRGSVYNKGFILYPTQESYSAGDVNLIEGNTVNERGLILPYGKDLEELSRITENSSNGFPIGVIPTFKKDYDLIFFYKQRQRGMIKDSRIPTFIELMDNYYMAIIELNNRELKRKDVESLRIFENGF